MAVEFQMPKLGLTMEEGTIVEWLVADDAEVAEGTPVVRIETDKVETEVESSGSGRLHHIGQPGQAYACGAVIAVYLEPGEAPPQAVSPAAAAPVAAAPAGAHPAPRAAPPAGQTAARTADGRVLASPNAKRVAAEAGVDIGRVSGTGPGGRIVADDVTFAVNAGMTGAGLRRHPRSAVARRSLPAWLRATSLTCSASTSLLFRTIPSSIESPAMVSPAMSAGCSPVRSTSPCRQRHRLRRRPGAAPELPPASQTPTRMIRMAGMRSTIAKRMHASLREMAQLTLSMDADMTAVVEDRGRRKNDGVTIGFTDYIVAAAARALLQHPNVNSQITSDGIAVLPDIHVGLAVALDEGLMVPGRPAHRSSRPRRAEQ